MISGLEIQVSYLIYSTRGRHLLCFGDLKQVLHQEEPYAGRSAYAIGSFEPAFRNASNRNAQESHVPQAGSSSR